MSQTSTPSASRRYLAELCPTIPLAPLIALLLLAVLLSEHSLRRPRLTRAITETLIHHRPEDLADAAAMARGDRRGRW